MLADFFGDLIDLVATTIKKPIQNGNIYTIILIPCLLSSRLERVGPMCTRLV
jgi:hypothetical protein